MRRSIATVSVSGSLDRKLKAIAGAGFDAVEIFENDLITYPGSTEEVRRMAADLGLAIDLYQPFRDFEAVSDQQFRRNLDRAEHKFDLMVQLGVNNMLACSNVSPDAIDNDELAASQLHTLAQRAAQRGFRISYEALSWGTHVSHFQQAYDLILLADHPSLGICLDSFHVLSLGDDPSRIATLRADKLFFLQIADAPLMKLDVLQWSRHFRCFPGQGGLKLAHFVQQVLATGYRGPLSLEVFNDVFRAASDVPIARAAMQSLLLLEEEVRTLSRGEATPASRAGSSPYLFSPPPPPAISGISFIEFSDISVDNSAGAPAERRLLQMLEKLGFALTGLHKSKDVALYTQGSINIILNRDVNAGSQGEFNTDPSFSALAIAVADAPSALARASAFLIPEYKSSIGDTESVIPAMRSIDGSLIYFITENDRPSFREKDFNLISPPGEPRSKVGLTHVDHITFALTPDLFDAEVLYLRSALGLHPGEATELADPYGLIKSLPLSNHDGTMRVVLNVSQSQLTTTRRAIVSNSGATLHHIALACTDIFATIAALRNQNIRFLKPSANYYDDLVSRLGLSQAERDFMQHNGILLDRSAAGSFYQAYTELIGCFYFEIVQRDGSYTGFGVGNAAVRMAAQSYAEGFAPYA